MSPTTDGLHHVTAIAGDPEDNADFYVNTLGLRLVKHTVNHDDPSTLHLYYGDTEGTPGTNITCFPWSSERRNGRFGAGQTSAFSYLIDPDSLDFWKNRLDEYSVSFDVVERFDNPVLHFRDPDGIGVELVADGEADHTGIAPWKDSPVDERHQLRGFYSVTLAVSDPAPTCRLLREVMGFDQLGEDGGRVRLRSHSGGPASVVDVVQTDRPRGRMGVGTIHHVAFKAADRDQQAEWRSALSNFGLAPTDVVDRVYFQSLYCREPGGVLFEFATMGPGFTRDEDPAELGSHLALPPWLEEDRDEIEAAVPQFSVP